MHGSITRERRPSAVLIAYLQSKCSRLIGGTKLQAHGWFGKLACKHQSLTFVRGVVTYALGDLRPARW
jgi:hypothetical protein